MIMSKATQTAINEGYAKIPNPVRDNLQNISVKLTGTTPTKAYAFVGSGVILYATEGTTYVITAKHNLYVFNDQKDPPIWSNSLLDQFSRVRICYDSPMNFNTTPTRVAPINRVTQISGDAASWAYDVIMLQSDDANLAIFAANNRLPALTHADLGFIYNANQYLSEDNSAKFILTGFGKQTERVGSQQKTIPDDPGTNISGALQYRLPTPIARKTTSVYNQTQSKSGYTQYTNCIQLKANKNDSTSEGDSGGPLFVYANNGGPKLYLIGVTVGSDMADAETPCPAGGVLRQNDISASLEFCYRNDAIFQGLIGG